MEGWRWQTQLVLGNSNSVTAVGGQECIKLLYNRLDGRVKLGNVQHPEALSNIIEDVSATNQAIRVGIKKWLAGVGNDAPQCRLHTREVLSDLCNVIAGAPEMQRLCAVQVL